MSWEDADALASRLNRNLDAFNWNEAEQICKHIVGRIKADSELLPEPLAKKLLGSLRRKRRFELVTHVAEALLQSGLRTPLIRRQYAQALIDQGVLAAAETLLEVSLIQPDIDANESTEAHGLLGRIYKQLYINNINPNSPHNRLNLERALKEYLETYLRDRHNNFWHGINVAALLARAQRDKQPVLSHWPDPLALAHEILATLEEREKKSEKERKNGLAAWELATRVEAYVALGQHAKAADTALKYIARDDADAFELRSTIRQFTEVWQLNDHEPPGNQLLPILKAGHLRKEGAATETDLKTVMEEAVATTQAAQGRTELRGKDEAEPLEWYKKALDRCRSIATVERIGGAGLGTGWLVKASDFFPDKKGLLLLTNDHVISNSEQSPGIRPAEAQANFHLLGQVFKLKEIVWSSSYLDLDSTFVSLEGDPEAAPLQLDSESTFEPSTRLYVISQGTREGAPDSGVGDETPRVSVQDTYLLAQGESVFHYRTPVAGITSGSPVFEPKEWCVVALHHASAAVVPRIDGREGAYESSEGISIGAIKRAIQAASASFAGGGETTADRVPTIDAEYVEHPQVSFRVTVEGEAVSGTVVQCGSDVDLVFEYVPSEVEPTFGLERTRKLQVPLGIRVTPVGFQFKKKTESGYKNLRFYHGAGDQQVRFELLAPPQPVAIENSQSTESGFHIILDLRGSVLRQLFLPAQLVNELPDSKREIREPELYTFDLDDLKRFDDQAVEVQQHVAAALTEGAGLNEDHATLSFNTAGAGLRVSCNIRHSSGPDDAINLPDLSIDRGTLANRITQVKNSMPAEATNIWAALEDPLAEPAPKVVGRFKECMERTIGEGHNLYSFLAGIGLASVLKQLDEMPERSRITINTDCAFFPWEILYSQSYSWQWPQSVKDQNPTPDPKKLWGYRFRINYNLMQQGATSNWTELMAAHRKGQPFISLNLNAAIANVGRPFQPIAYHRDFYTQHLSPNGVGKVYESATDIEGQLYSADQQATVLYLYCHGRNSVPFAVDNSEALEFETGRQLDPGALGASTNVYARAPIVFLNSCTSGQPSPLSFSSFHTVFRQKKAMGIIGTSIEMPITFGAAFGCRLLEEYLKGEPLGSAMYALRRELVDKGNPLGLFYSLQCPAEVKAPAV